MRNDAAEYPENSRSAVLRVAIMVAYSDRYWHEMERAQLEDVYRNICVMLDDDLDDELLLSELESISTEVTEEIEDLVDDEDVEEYWQTCMEPIDLADIQQLAVAAALALSSGDSEIDAQEASGLARLCNEWDVELADAQDIWND